MNPFSAEDHPIAGPSSQPFTPSPTDCPLNSACPFLYTTPTIIRPRRNRYTPRLSKLDDLSAKYRRQDNGQGAVSSSEASSDSLGGTTAFDASASTTQRPLFTGPSPSPSSSSSVDGQYNATSAYATGTYNGTTDYQATSTSSSSYYRSTSFTSLWSYSASRSRSYTASASQPSQTAFVPGVLLNLTLGGDSDTEAVYSVDVDLGHGANDPSAEKRSLGRRRPPTWNGLDVQTLKLQVDLGSSDMWVATTDCTSSSCQTAPSLFNASQSLQSGVSADITYQSGSVDGNIYWEEIQVGDFGIGYQAFIAATDISNEDLKGGNFAGVLGLALPASSTILTNIGGTTSSDPDGATFLDNLFGAGASAPSERLFALALERREDVRTSSTFGIGAVDQNICPSPCEPPYIPIISQPQLGVTGYLHWRIPIQGVSVTTWDDQENGTGPTITNVTLGPSQVYATRPSPLAVLDSGGVQILTGYRQYADAIYSAMGVSMSSDGFYRLPCTQQMALTFNIAGQAFPVHPLDMTYPDPEDASQKQCIGMIQYSSNLGESGDFILGSSFMKNVYSIFQYPDTNKQKTWQPTVGLISLTNASIASQDFYAVRVQRQSLASVSSDQQVNNGGSPTNPGSQPSHGAAEKKVVNTTVIAVVSVVGFFVLAAAAFCAWWFWLRRKFGAAGVVTYRSAPERPKPAGYKSDSSFSSLRNKKHTSTQRQKSMVEGFSGSEYEGDSWMSTTEGNDSIRLGYLPEVAEEDDDDARRTRAADKRSSRGSTLGGGITEDPEEYALIDMNDPSSPTPALAPALAPAIAPGRVRTRSPPPPLPHGPSAGHHHTDSADLDLPNSASSETIPLASAPYPSTVPPPPPPQQKSRKPSITMSGPFPSSTSMSGPFPSSTAMSGPFPSPGNNNRHSMRPDISPMYDIRTSDYFSVPPVNSRGREHRRGSSGGGEGRRESSGRRRSSPSKGPRGIEGVQEEGEERFRDDV
ncbi:hypothetical protein I302_103564 [Kwoniella bestiolae CBS 10118]|uniref:Peptidase A1 domain-containing protein n=1 Tax=Kwoniella bestiolae CBS 10118 TaxID=1296100 RepID=A0A1B9G8T9_9TREE|nr:hypothetical protein I302_02265 [Kwoniella bestiolae CBS 10118]OCF27423.1 hypothetical protein I302_02265 [Kwoniella bestiolae CBS 10118]